MPEKEQELLPVRIWESVKTFGLRAFFASFSDSSRMLPRAYEPWLFRHRASEEQLRAQRKKGAGRKTSLTLVTVLKEADPQAFADMLASLKGQTFSGFELLLIDLTAFGDGGTDLQAELRSAAAEAAHSGLRLRHFLMKDDLEFADAVNFGIRRASGTFLAVLPPEDLLPPESLYRFAETIRKHREAELFYADHDSVSYGKGRYFDPVLKPDLDPVLLLHGDYIGEFYFFRKETAAVLGGFRRELSGAETYDFLLRLTAGERETVHLPAVLRHRRGALARIPAEDPREDLRRSAMAEAVRRELAGRRISGEVLPAGSSVRIRCRRKKKPLISVILINTDRAADLRRCVDFLLDSTEEKLEILIVECCSRERETFELYRDLAAYPQVKLIRWMEELHLSKMLNYAAGYAAGEYFLFFSRRIRSAAGENWLTGLLDLLLLTGAGSAGPALLTPDERTLSRGLIVREGIILPAFPGEEAARVSRILPREAPHTVSALSGDCLLVRREAFLQAEGFSDDFRFRTQAEDLCLRLRENGWRCVTDPGSGVVLEDIPETPAPTGTEEIFDRDTFRQRWETKTASDPYYPAAASAERGDYLPKLD